MLRLSGLRALGAVIAGALFLYVGVSVCAAITRPNFRPSDLFSFTPQNEMIPPGASFTSWLSVSGDFLADYAAARAEKVLNHPALDPAARASENQAARQALINALNVSPLRPALWLALGTLETQAGGSIVPALKMSYLTGGVSAETAFVRLETVTSSSAASDEDLGLMAESDIRMLLAQRSRFKSPLVATYVQALPAGKKLLLDATQTLDPGFNALLRRY